MNNDLLFIIIESIIKSLILCIALLTAFAYSTWLERKFIALIQQRIGPNTAGPAGLLHPVADAIKLFLKEEVIPAQADKVMFIVAPIITGIPALIILGATPFGPDIELFGRTIRLAVTDINVGLLYFLGIASIAVYGIVLAGWASESKYATMGGMRSTAQMVSYEIALGLAIVGPVLAAGSLSMLQIVQTQQGPLLPQIPFINNWFILSQPVAAIIFYVAALAEVNRSPFDMPEAEQELTAGYHTEYSGMKFGMFFMSEYIKMVAVSAIFATLFLGGYDGPFVREVPLLGPLYIGLKIVASIAFMIWIRGTLPRMRYDQLMDFGWKVMLPLALANVVVTAFFIAFVA